MNSPSLTLKEEKLKKTLYSLEMEQSYIFKDKKTSNDKKLSPWNEKKSHIFQRSNRKVTSNKKCQDFLKKVLFKKADIFASRRHKTENV